MKRWILRVALCVAIFAAIGARPALAQEREGAGAAGAASGEHVAAGADGEHEAHAPLLPANAAEAKEYFLAPAIWTLVIFLIMLAILYPTAWKNVLAGLKAREQRIRKDIADAEAARAKAEATLRQYNEQLATAEARVREILSKGATDAEKLATSIRMQAQQEAEEAKERATREIEASKNAAIAQIYEQAAELSTTIASKIIRRNLNAQDQQDLVRQSLDELQTVGSANAAR